VSTPTPFGILELHFACGKCPLNIVELMYNAHPQAIHARTDGDGGRHWRGGCSSDRARIRPYFQIQLELERQALEQRRPDNQGQLPIHRALLGGSTPVGTIKLMAAANLEGLTVTDNLGRSPVHIAIQSGQVNSALAIIEANPNTLRVTNSSGDLPLHLACLGGHCNLVNHILDRDVYGVSPPNADHKLKLPIQALIYHADCDRDSLEYVEAVGRLLYANPVSITDLCL
jgi:ankyrin repeat protein